MGELEKTGNQKQEAPTAPDAPLNSEAQGLLGMPDTNAKTAIGNQGETAPAVDTAQTVTFGTPQVRYPGTNAPLYEPKGPATQYQTHPGVFASPTAPTCKPNSTYDQLYQKAVRNLYDPSPLTKIPDLTTRYNCLIQNDTDALNYMRQALKETSDPYSTVIMPVEATAQEKDRSGKHGDIGVTFKTVDGRVQVDVVTPGSSAESAGLKKGDVITHLNNQDVSRKSQKEIQDLITASDDTTLGVRVWREGKFNDFRVARTEKEVASIKDFMLPENVLYMRMENMDPVNQADEMKRVIEGNPKAEAYILDLRRNPGGLFNNSFKLASLFMDKGTLLKTTRRVDSDPENPAYKTSYFVLTPEGIKNTTSLDPAVKPDSMMARYPKMTDKPLVILVDRGTASAAEILAVSLQENGAAKIVGEKSFGKGIGQTVFTGMPGGGALKLTTFRYYSPSGKWFGDGNKVQNGVEPDIKETNMPGTVFGTSSDLQLQAARKYLQTRKAAK